MTYLQKRRKDNEHFQYCPNCATWFDCRDLNQVVPHFACNEKTNLLTGISVAKTEWSQSLCLSTGETYHNPDPVTNPLLKKTIDRNLLRKMNLRLKGGIHK